MTDILIAAGLFAMVWFVIFGGDSKKEIAALRREVRDLKRIVDGLAASQGYVAPPSELSPQVQDLMREGRKIAAIKQPREETGLGLAEAKAAVEAWERG